jgi:hypothetical protein
VIGTVTELVWPNEGMMQECDGASDGQQHFLRRSGETVLVLDRSRPIARIERVGGPPGAAERLTRLEEAGLVCRPSWPLPLKVLTADPQRSRRKVLVALLEERAEDR